MKVDDYVKKKVLIILVLFISALFFGINVFNASPSIENESNNGNAGVSVGGNGKCDGDYGWCNNEMQGIQVRIFDSNNNKIAGPTYYYLKKTASNGKDTVKGSRICGLTPGNEAKYDFTSIKRTNSDNPQVVASNYYTCWNVNSDHPLNVKDIGINESIWGMFFSNAISVNSKFTNNDYSLLKRILADMGYTFNANTDRDDYVIIEPLVTIKAGGIYYTGTVTALLAVDSKYDLQIRTGSWNYINIISLIAQTFKVQGSGSCYSSLTDEYRSPCREWAEDKNGKRYCKKYYTYSDGSRLKIHGITYDTPYSKCGYNKYKIKDLYRTCTYDEKTKLYYDANGNSSTSNDSYNETCKCTIRNNAYYGSNANFIGNVGDNTAAKKYAEQCLDCTARVPYATTPKDRIELYNDFKSSGKFYSELLDFSKNGAAACKNDENDNLNGGCLSINLAPETYPESIKVNFSEKDISAYNFIVDIASSDNKAYCLARFNLSSPYSSFLGTATQGGMAYIGGDTAPSTVATGTLKLKCYLYNPAKGDENIDIMGNLNYNNFISSVSFSNQELAFDLNDSVTRPSGTPGVVGNYKGTKYIVYEKTITRRYITPLANVKIESGKLVSDSSSDTRKLYGYFSKLGDTGTNYVPFSVKLNNMIINNKLSYVSTNACYYTVDGKEYIEPKFRTIDTSNPFIGKNDVDNKGNGRTVGANWCYKNEDGTYDCSSKNQLVQNVIINSNNSYNVKNQQPLYKITLTPSDIKTIREYNATHKLDEFDLVCDNNYKCKSLFFLEISDTISIGKDKLVPSN